MAKERNKLLKQNIVAEKILILLAQQGTQAVTHAKLARAAKVSRPWLYKYIGSSKNDLLEFAVAFFGRIYAELDCSISVRTPKQWVEEQMRGFNQQMDDSTKYPWILAIYFRFSGQRDIVGRAIAVIEKKYF